jgi:LPXTG-site transpeptidase (sortase) family protein
LAVCAGLGLALLGLLWVSAWSADAASASPAPVNGLARFAAGAEMVDIPSRPAVTIMERPANLPTPFAPNPEPTAGVPFNPPGGPQGITITTPADVQTSDDLRVRKDSSALFMVSSTEDYYTITVEKTSSVGTLTGQILVTDTLPNYVSFGGLVSGVPPWSCNTSDSKNIYCSMNLDQPVTDVTIFPEIVFSVTVTKEAAPSVVNTVTVGISSDPTYHHQDSTPTEVASAKIKLTMGVEPATNLYTGMLVTYTLTIYNAGPTTAPNANLVEFIPSELTLVSTSASQGTYLNGLWSAGQLPSGSSAVLTLVARISAAEANRAIVNSVAEVHTGDDEHLPNPLGTSSGDSKAININVTKLKGLITGYDGRSNTYLPVPYAVIELTDSFNRNFSAIADANGNFVVSPTQIASPIGGGKANLRVYKKIKNSFALDCFVDNQTDLPQRECFYSYLSTIDIQPGIMNTASPTPTLATSDIYVEKSDGTSKVIAGQKITYTISIKNQGNIPALSLVVQEGLVASSGAPKPVYVTDTLSKVPGVIKSLDTTNHVYNWQFPATIVLNAQETFTFYVQFQIPSSAQPTARFTNTVLVTSTAPEAYQLNNFAMDVDAVQPPIVVKKLHYPVSPAPGSIVTYTLLISNVTGNLIKPVYITDDLLSNLTYISYSIPTSVGSYNYTRVSTTRNFWQFLDGMAAGQQNTIIMRTQIPTSAANSSQIKNRIAAGPYSSGSIWTTNYYDDLDTVVVPPKTTMSITLEVKPSSGCGGRNFTFKISVTNAGTLTAQEIKVKDQFNYAFLDILTYKLPDGATAEENTTDKSLTVKIPSLAAKSTVNIQIVVNTSKTNAPNGDTTINHYSTLTCYNCDTKNSNTKQFTVLGKTTLACTGGMELELGPSASLQAHGGQLEQVGAPAGGKDSRAMIFAAASAAVLSLLGLVLLGWGFAGRRGGSEWSGWALRAGLIFCAAGVGFGAMAYLTQPSSTQRLPAPVTWLTGRLLPTDTSQPLPTAQSTFRPRRQTATPVPLSELPEFAVPSPSAAPSQAPGEQGPDTSGVTHMLIPALQVDAAVKFVPFDGATWVLEGLTSEIAWLGDTSWPGLGGNTGLAGHVTLNSGAYGPFRYISTLKEGEAIVLDTEKNEYTYQVTRQFQTNANDMSVLEKTSRPTITLITCTNWDDQQKIYLSRLIVQAELVGVTPLETRSQ